MRTLTRSKKNHIKEFRATAGRMADRIEKVDGVIGMIFLGGLAREYADRYSDIDITVFVRKRDADLVKRMRAIVGEEEAISGFEADLEIHEVEEFEEREWTEMDRWELGNAEIVYDPEGRIKRLMEKGLTVPEDFWIDRIAACYTYLSWYCCPRKGLPTVAEICMERGDPVSAHHCVSYSIDLFMDLLFAINRKFVPPPKWKVSYCRELDWIPKDFDSKLRKAMIISNMTSEQLAQRLKALKSMWREVVQRIQKTTGLDDDGLTRRFVERTLCQSEIV